MRVTFVDKDERIPVEAKEGESILELARAFDIDLEGEIRCTSASLKTFSKATRCLWPTAYRPLRFAITINLAIS